MQIVRSAPAVAGPGRFQPRGFRCGGWPASLALAAGLGCGAAMAQPAEPAPQPADAEPVVIDTVVVTATRTAESPYNVPASVDVIGGSEFNDGTLGVNLTEGLQAVPGLLARDRQNYAQDSQISIRGFGARSTFGIRGVRLLLDGIPATQPDGQGQVSHFNLATADRVEVLRGPFSALYGNSSGGVIQMFTADGRDPADVSFGAAGGSYGTWRTNVGASGTAEVAETGLDYTLGYQHFSTDGFRDHSAAQRESVNGKLGIKLGTAGKLTLVFNSFDSPDAQDPLGLTRAQFDANPSQAAPVAEQFDTRKSAKQNQGGAIYETDLTSTQNVRVLAYYGNRGIEQYLAIPKATQSNPKHSGGVVDLGTDYGGTDARWTWHTQIAQRPFTLVAGLTWDDLSQDRRGYENFVGNTLGVKGALRRDETDDVYDLDEYLQANWQFADRWSLLAGVRHSQVKFDSDDHYVTTGNPDDSGKADYSATTPVAGLLFKFNDALHWYASYGRGFETPTFAELAYKPNGDSGLNLSLSPAHTDNAEMGFKLQLPRRTRAELAVFTASTDNELAICSNSGGRTAYCNIDTQRTGMEFSFDTELAHLLRLNVAYTLLDASVRKPYQTCTSVPCATPNATVDRNNHLPGVPDANFYGALLFGGRAGWQASIDGRYVSAVPVNDVNSESAPSYGLLGLSGGYVFDLERWRARLFVNLDNVLDQDYVGSVIVNDGNGRYYEPGPGRSVLAGLSLDWKY